MKSTKALFALVLIAPIALTAHATPPHGQKDASSGLVFDCANFEPLANGNWIGNAHATATFKGSRFNFAGTIFRSGEAVIDGVDMKSRLDAQCLAGTK